MIEAHGLTRRYGEFTAVEDLSFSIAEGEIVGFLGPNGAGKTTTLRMITGFLPPTTGELTVAGKNLFTEPVAARREVGYLPENVALYGEMRVSEYLGYRAMLEGLSRTEAKRRLADAIDSCILVEVENQIIGTLSKGYRQRVGLAAAILHHPKVLVLDEPTVGLDPKQIIAIRELIRDLGREQTLLLSSHILPEVELICDRVIIIDRGRIIAEGSPSDLKTGSDGSSVIQVELKDAPPSAPEVLGRIEDLEVVEAPNRPPGVLTLECTSGRDVREEVFRACVANEWVLLELKQERASLEDVFVRLTTREEASVAASPPDLEAEASEEAP